ncbi:MAG: DUF4159 domain-containing protein [Acidobacteriia bacterium]|nr:DUF4159 domain-containing protein [Terriglobia bacterium]
MRNLHRLAIAVCTICLAGTAVVAQKPFRSYPGMEYDEYPLPPDWNVKADWVLGRLRYPDVFGYPFKSLVFQDGREFPGYWTMDYPRSDRHLLTGVRRLTRIDARPVEQVVTLDGTDDVYNWPILYAVEAGHWALPDDQAKQLGEFLRRGGFMMFDDFHGSQEFNTFTASMNKVLPGRPIVDIPPTDPIFHVLFDADQNTQVPGAMYFETGLTYEKGESGTIPHWRGIYDDKGRLMIIIGHNMDLGDAWEHSDEARYPEKWSSVAYRMAMNYLIYDLTH